MVTLSKIHKFVVHTKNSDNQKSTLHESMKRWIYLKIHEIDANLEKMHFQGIEQGQSEIKNLCRSYSI